MAEQTITIKLTAMEAKVVSLALETWRGTGLQWLSDEWNAANDVTDKIDAARADIVDAGRLADEYLGPYQGPPLPWRELQVSYAHTTDIWGSLGRIVLCAKTMASGSWTVLELRKATYDATGIIAWPGWYIHAPGEQPSANTPACAVDWTGFAEAMANACGEVSHGG